MSGSAAEIERVAVVTKLELFRARHDARMSRSDGERVVADCHVRSTRALQGLYLRFADVPNRHATLASVRMVGDLGALHSQNLADQRMEHCRHSARLSREDLGERIALLGRSAGIEIQRG